MSLTNKKNRLVYLASLSLLLSSLEYLIPKPVPFLKLGLANLPLIISLPFLGGPEYFFLAFSKAIMQGIVGGTIISPFFAISLAGTLATALVMFLSFRLLKHTTFVGISVIGALASNCAQLLMAALIIYGKSILVALPYILALGIITSAILGYLSNIFYKKSNFIRQCESNTLLPVETVIELNNKKVDKKDNKTLNIIFLVLAFCFIILSVVLSQLKLLIAVLVLSYIIQVASKRKLKFSYPLILLISMVLLSLLEPNGKVVFKYFTDVSLKLAFTKAIRILILIASSQILVGSTTINIGFVENIFTMSSIILDKFGKVKGSIIDRIDKALIGDSK
jgi:heptaprenyl diphosphate synthase